MVSRNHFDKTIYKLSFPGLVYLNTRLVGRGLEFNNQIKLDNYQICEILHHDQYHSGLIQINNKQNK